ncbi:PREDICTED: killer cell lectin-like receptor subfamily B member 1, partial [Nanorana parkeri]|uniref:killer cell lectin-like receptor subfamily B member 1 n=1 Tax=Nanorana parkeri TaxID=125878 RepID=UPI0008541879
VVRCGLSRGPELFLGWKAREELHLLEVSEKPEWGLDLRKKSGVSLRGDLKMPTSFGSLTQCLHIFNLMSLYTVKLEGRFPYYRYYDRPSRLVKCIVQDGVSPLLELSIHVWTPLTDLYHSALCLIMAGNEGNMTHRLQEMDRKLKCVTERTQDNVPLQAEIHNCPENWTIKDKMCYYFSEREESRDQSDKFCMSYEARLATVRSSQTGLLTLVKNLGKDFWIGLKKEHRDTYEEALWYWSDNNTELQVKKDAEGMTCAKLAEEVTAEPCTSKLRWICEKEAETHFYKTISDCLQLV